MTIKELKDFQRDFYAQIAALVAHDDWLEGRGPFAPDPVVGRSPRRRATTGYEPDQKDILDYVWNEPGAPFHSADY